MDWYGGIKDCENVCVSSQHLSGRRGQQRSQEQFMLELQILPQGHTLAEDLEPIGLW